MIDECEGHWTSFKNNAYYAPLIDRLANDRQLPDDRLKLYNSGVCGLHRTNADLFERAVKRIDRWSGLAQRMTVLEQEALSFELA